MSTVSVVDVFAAAGVAAEAAGTLDDALRLLALRLDLAGAGDLVEAVNRACWTPHEGECPTCGHKGNPQPHPKPQPKPQPPKPTGPKGLAS